MIIALYSPYPQCGKSTAARVLMQKHGFVRARLAEPLKRMLTALFQCSGFGPGAINEMIEGRLKEMLVPGLGVTPRYMMETLGSSWGRDTVCKSLWLDIARRKLLDHMDFECDVVVDDVRFPNEYLMLATLNARLVRVVRPTADPHVQYHCEGQLEGKEFDATLVNDGSLEDFHHQVDHLLRRFKNLEA